LVKKLVILGVVAVAVVGVISLYLYFGRNNPETTLSDQGEPVKNPVSQSDPTAQDAVALYRQAQTALANGQTDRARQLFEEVVTRFPDKWGARRACLELGDMYYTAGEHKKALDAYRKGQDAAETEQAASAVRSRISELEMKLSNVVQNGQPDASYVVRPNETLTSIAKDMETKVEILLLANNMTNDRIRAGQTLRISRVYPEIVVERDKYTLTLLWKNTPVRSFQVGIGKNNSTPVGQFVVENKIIHPPWTRPSGGVIPYGDPENILGTRWMGLKGTSEHTGYGIHGTTQPETVPGPTSAGCVRMRNADVEELFQWVPIGTKVTIK